MYLIYMRLLIATIVLLICLLNFINLFINDFVERTKDLAIREIFGAERRKLYMLVLQKSFIISFLAGIIACCILLLSGRILVVPNPLPVEAFGIVAFLVVFSCLLSSLAPLINLRTSRIGTYLHGQVFGKVKGKNYRRFMVLIQTAVSMMLITCAIVIYLQLT